MVSIEAWSRLKGDSKLKVNVKFKSRFRDLFHEEGREVNLPQQANVRELLNLLCDTPKRRFQVFDNECVNLRPNVAVTRNGLFVIHLNWLDTKLSEGDTVELFNLFCGG
jgi:sulfur carrier protein ThiS